MESKILKRIKSLPPLPQTVKDIDKISKEHGTAEDLVKAIEKDPMLVAGLLKIANSPLYGFSRKIKDIQKAVSLFGLVTSISLVKGISIKRLLKVDIEPYGISPEQFVLASSKQASLSKFWFKTKNPKKLNDLFLCALLQETGKILIADEIIKANEVRNFKNDILMAVSISQVEKKYIGMSTAAVTASIFDFWDFEKDIVYNIKYSENPQNSPMEYKEIAWALQIIRKAVSVVSPLDLRNITLALSLAEQAGFDKEELLEAIKKVKEE